MYSRTVFYARVSSTKQDTLSQQPALEKYAKDHGVKFTLVEDTGTGKNMKRAGIQSIMRGIEGGEIKEVVCVSLNRVGRNVRQVSEFIDLCVEHEVSLICLREKIDLGNAFGRCIAMLVSCLSQLENEQRSEATKDGIAAAKAAAERLGRPWKTGNCYKGYSTKVSKVVAETILYWRRQNLNYCAIGRIVHLSDKTVREVCLNPQRQYITRAQMAAIRKNGLKLKP